MKITRRSILLTTSFFYGLMAAMSVGAQGVYPDRPIRLLVGFAPGGAADLAGRAFADALSERLGKQVIIENRPGAGGVVAAIAAAKADTDGYTLLFGSSALSVQLAIDPSMQIDPLNDLVSIALVSEVPNVLVVSPDLPVRNVRELILYGQAGRTMSFGSSGIGTSLHLSGEILKDVAQLNMVHVPYKGSAGALTDLMSGRIEMMFDSLATSLPLIKGGKIRPLAVTSRGRSSLLPDVPTMLEAGYENFETSVWFGLFAPKKLPAPIVARLASITTASLGDPKVVARLANLSMDVLRSESPERFSEFFKRDIQRWKNTVIKTGVKVEKN